MKPFLYADVETIPSANPRVFGEITERFAVPKLDLDSIKPDARLKDEEKIEADIAAKRAKAHDDHAAAGDKAYANIQEAYRKTALDGAQGHLASIAWTFNDQHVVALYNTALEGFTAEKSYKIHDAVLEGERVLLTEFFTILDRQFHGFASTALSIDFENKTSGRGGTFNGMFRDEYISANIKGAIVAPVLVAHFADFDIRFIWQRAIALGVAVPSWWPVNASKYKDDQVQDTMVQWAGHGSRISLDALCRALGVPGKSGFDGSMVWDAVKAGKIEEVRIYNIEDVRRLRSVHRRMRGLAVLATDLEQGIKGFNAISAPGPITAAEIDAGFQAVKDQMTALGYPTDMLVNYPDNTMGYVYASGDFPEEWSIDYPFEERGLAGEPISARACTWGQWKAEQVAYNAARKLERDTEFVNDIVAAVPLDFANAVDGNGNPVGWEE